MAVPPPLATEGGFYGCGWNLLIEQDFQKKPGRIHKRNHSCGGNIMASPNAPASSALLIARYCKTHVLVQSEKKFVAKFKPDLNGRPVPAEFSRPLSRGDCLRLLIKKFG